MARSSQFGPVTSAVDPITQPRTSATVIAADSATLTEVNIPPAQALNCRVYDTIFVGCEIDGGTNPTLTVEPLFYDKEATDDGSRWKRVLTGAADGVTLAAATIQSTGAMASGSNLVELRVFGHPAVFLRVSAVANATSTTGYRLLAMPGKTRNVAAIPT